MAGIITKKAISSTLSELLKEKTIDKITIAELTEKCGINRQTFYYHFSDIYDLLEWTFEEELKNYSYENNNTTYQEALENLRKLILRKREIYINAYNPRNHIYYETFLFRQIYPVIYAYILKNENAKDVSEDRIDFLVRCSSKIVSSLLIQWISGGAKTEDLGDWSYISLLLDEDDISTLLIRFKEN